MSEMLLLQCKGFDGSTELAECPELSRTVHKGQATKYLSPFTPSTR